MAFEAQYRGVCQTCCEDIEPGQRIKLTDPHAPVSGYSHEECPDQPDERPTKFQGSSLEEMGF